VAEQKSVADTDVRPPMPAYQRERRKRIVAAARAALDEQEYEQIQMRDVAARADVALGTLYRYFGSKEHLYAAVMLDWVQPLHAEQRLRSTAPRSAAERLRRRVHASISAFEQHPQYFKVLMLLTHTADERARELYVEFSGISMRALSRELEVLGRQQAEDVTMMIWSTFTTMLTASIYHGRSLRDLYRVCDGLIDLVEPKLREAEAATAREA